MITQQKSFLRTRFCVGCLKIIIAKTRVLKKLVDGDVIAKNAFVICESGEEDIFGDNDELRGKFEIQKQARYSISYVTVLRPQEA